MIVAAISTWSIHVISALGYVGIAILMAIESSAVPLPSEIIMPFSGFLVLTGRFSLLGISLAGGIGSVIGSLFLYYIGFYGGRPLVEKYGKYLLIHSSDIAAVDKFFSKYGIFSNLFGRVLPIVRTFISFPAGISKAPIKSFVVYSFVGSFIWSLFLGYIGFKLGQNWDNLKSYFHNIDLIVGVLVLLGIAWFVYKHVRRGLAKN